ncbi:hypothetical protein C5O00_05475 [Pukyongia salina]|uniref:Uncharacterized protein n=1 Tax=Pukyongia salina TaxID=2094025 RepID=A0A2S0HVK4_9FLAO|nr:hypothetical protein [Pukyongia salina]AVI50648.1 hypothetical protein C5O00_05475 [Pukyongia salina]
MKTKSHLFQFISPVIFMALFANCGGSKSGNTDVKLEQDPPFSVKDAYYQDWVAGIKEGGSGTNVYLALENFTDKVVIEKIYFRKKITKAQISPQIRNQYVGYFKNDDKDMVMDIDPVKEAVNAPREPFPFSLEHNEAVIAYRNMDVLKYTLVRDMRREEMIAYPSTKPKNEH